MKAEPVKMGKREKHVELFLKKLRMVTEMRAATIARKGTFSLLFLFLLFILALFVL